MGPVELAAGRLEMLEPAKAMQLAVSGKRRQHRFEDAFRPGLDHRAEQNVAALIELRRQLAIAADQPGNGRIDRIHPATRHQALEPRQLQAEPTAHPRHGELEHALERVGSNMMRSLQVLEHNQR